MGCRPSYQGNRLVMDCITCGLGLTTSACLDSHLKTISTLETPWKTMRYEEEMIVELDEEKSKIFTEYVAIVRQIEALLINPAIYGRPEDEQLPHRQKLLRDFYNMMFSSPQQAAQLLQDYNEPLPEKQVYMEGYRTFQAWVNGIVATYKKSRLYSLSLHDEDLRQTFMSILSLRSMPAVQSVLKQVPAGAKVIDGGQYDLPFGLRVKIYEVPGADSYLYVQENTVMENLPKELVNLMQDTITEENKSLKETIDFSTIFDSKMRTFRQKFMDYASLHSIALTPAQALAMGREAAGWTVGLGSPIENMSLDRDNITDIYLDAENAAIYIEHQKFGLCHTLWQYNHEMLERTFRNITVTVGGSRKFDKDNPIIDVVLPRLAMRCHLQRPPATFAELQAALRIMKEQPFTYAEYLKYQSFTPFFAGYDDVLVGLGCSEAVLGLKGVGKTAFTAAKIMAIGLKRRILPIQDIEEIPVRAYRKRGFHIGGVRVQSSDREETSNTSSELDLVAMTNASLRMGDACVIINEIRSRTAIQGVLNMLNTQPGIFLLYNLHAQSLKDIQDRLELVFGMPAASMYSTDRYSFLKKVRFGRKSRMYRMLGYQFETDLDKHTFTPIFTMARGEDLTSTKLVCEFCDLPEASSRELFNADLGSIAKRLKLKFVPPALKRRADETGLPINDYVMEAFYKGKLYDLCYRASLDYDEPDLVEIDFVLKALSAANRILKEHAAEMDWSGADKQMMSEFHALLDQEMADRVLTRQSTGQKAKGDKASAPKTIPPAPAPKSAPHSSTRASPASKPAAAIRRPFSRPPAVSDSRKNASQPPPKAPPKDEILDEDPTVPDQVV